MLERPVSPSVFTKCQQISSSDSRKRPVNAAVGAQRALIDDRRRTRGRGFPASSFHRQLRETKQRTWHVTTHQRQPGAIPSATSLHATLLICIIMCAKKRSFAFSMYTHSSDSTRQSVFFWGRRVADGIIISPFSFPSPSLSCFGLHYYLEK